MKDNRKNKLKNRKERKELIECVNIQYLTRKFESIIGRITKVSHIFSIFLLYSN